MAPEIIQNQKYDAKEDLWSVGAILYELVIALPEYFNVHRAAVPQGFSEGPASGLCGTLQKSFVPKPSLHRSVVQSFQPVLDSAPFSNHYPLPVPTTVFQTIMALEEDSNCVESRAKCAQLKDTYVGGSSSSLPTTGQGDEMPEPKGVYVDLEDDEDDAQTQEPESGTSRQKSRKLTSNVWRTFERIMVNGQQKPKCRYCKKVMSANSGSGTSHLKKHAEKVCSGRHLRLGVRQRKLKVTKEDDGTNTLELKASHEDTFDQEFSRKELLSMVECMSIHYQWSIM